MPSLDFHLCHIIPHPRIHGLNGYNEVIETVRWGLEALGNSVSYAVNTFRRPAINIVFGAQMLSLDEVQALPDNTIVYNFEQIRGLQPEQLKPGLLRSAERLQVWDYSTANLEIWGKVPRSKPVLNIPVGWAPVLRRIEKPERQDIEVLFYGRPGNSRLNTLSSLCHAGVYTVFACGLYGADRDNLIARAKVVLNLNFYEHSRILEVPRISYLLANAKAVVTDWTPETFVEPDLLDAMSFCSSNDVVEKCQAILADDSLRVGMEEQGEAIFQKRDIRDILRVALADSGY